jgi:hypothetical protein
MCTISRAAAVRSLSLGLPSLAPKTLHGQVDVLEAGQPGQQRVVLEHHRPLRAGPGDLAAVAQHHPRGGQGEAGDEVEQRGFAAARVADQRHDLSGADLQIDVLQGDEAAFLRLEAMPTFSTLTIAFMVNLLGIN